MKYQKVRLPLKVPQHEEECQHEHTDRRRQAGKKNNIVLKDRCPSYDFSDAGHMGAKPGLLQHGAEDDHQE